MEQPELRYARNPEYIFRSIVGEAVLVPIHDQVADMECIYTLNAVGSFVWQRLEVPATEADLRLAILQEFEADPATVAADLDRFLQGMVEVGAIRRG